MKILRALRRGLTALSLTATATTAHAADLDTADTETGEGRAAEAGDTVAVHYEGRLTDGTVFDSSYDRGQPIVFSLGAGQVIRGWDMGIEGMTIGDKRTLTIPPELGYGNKAVGSIPAGSTLVFDVELVDIQ